MSGRTFITNGKEQGYRWVPDGLDVVYPRVTDITGKLANEAFVGAAIRETTNTALANLEALTAMPKPDATRLLKGAWWSYFNDAGRRGTQVHKTIEALCRDDNLDDIHPNMLPYLAGAQQFLDAHVNNILHIEATIFNRTYRYAGTADLIAEMTPNEHIPEPHIAVIDWKSGSGIYPNQMLQLVAYAKGDFIADFDTHTELPIPNITHGYLVHIPGDSTYNYKVEPMTDRLFKAFIGARSLQKFVDQIEPTLFQVGGGTSKASA